ncbi:MAG: hypothetical protein ACW99A_11405, partial [Candidatus Kariarchaeaceae archaeon]
MRNFRYRILWFTIIFTIFNLYFHSFIYPSPTIPQRQSDSNSMVNTPFQKNSTSILDLDSQYLTHKKENNLVSLALFQQDEVYQPQNDALSGTDAPGQEDPRDFKEGLLVDFNTNYTGTMGNGYITSENSTDKYDAYQFRNINDGHLTLDIKFNTSFTSFAGFIWVQSFDTGSLKRNYQFNSQKIQQVIAAGSYILMFDGRDIDSPLTYNFTISFQEGVFPQQNDAGSLHDAEPEHYDGPREGQIVLPLNSSISGTIGGDLYSIANDDIDRIDVYAFPNITFGIVNVTLTITSSTNPSLLSLYLMRPNCCSLDLMSINVNSTIESLSSGTEINYSEDLHGSGGYFLYLFLRDIDQSIVDPLKSDYANYVEYQIDVFYVGEIEGDFETGSSQLVISESTSETSTFLINKTDLVEDPIEQLGINSTSLLVMVGAILLSPMLYI